MKDTECVLFLQWALPRLHMRWPGFRKVRGQVCKRLSQRLSALNLADMEAYQNYLETHAEEWSHLDALCRVTISRFYREKAVFQFMEQQVFPKLIQYAAKRGDKQLRLLSLGSASGEEPYTLALLWHLHFQKRYPDFIFTIVAAEADPVLIQRAQQACYPFSSVRNLPPTWLQTAFSESNGMFCLKPEYRSDVRFAQLDIREAMPAEKFDLVMCRNLAFTYFDEPLQQHILNRVEEAMREEGVLVIGIHENLIESQNLFTTLSERLRVFIKKRTD